MAKKSKQKLNNRPCNY